MPIVIEHEANPALAGALAFLASRGQRAQQQKQQDFDNALRIGQMQMQWELAQQQDQRQRSQFDAENQLRRDLANQQVGLQREENAQRRSAARAAAGLAFLDRQQQLAQATAAQRQREQANAAELAARQQQALMEQQAEIAKAQQQQQLEQMRSDMEQRNKLMQVYAGVVDPEYLAQTQFLTKVNQNALAIPDQYELEKIRTGIRNGDPGAISEGLQRHILQFSPEQLTRIRQIREAMAQAEMDPNMSPAQRAMASRQLAEKLNAIRPMEVPPENQPASIQQQFSQDVPIFTDPVTGHKFMATRNRNGVWEPFEPPHIKNEVERQQLEHKQRLDEEKSKRDAEMEVWKTDNKIWLDQKPEPKDFRTMNADGLETDDKGAFQAAYNEWLTRRPSMPGRQQPPALPPPQATGQPSGGGNMADSLAARSGDHEITPRLSPNRQQGQQQWASLPIGAVTQLPDGRTVRKTGPTSYEPVQ